jgi:hypothetical protein
VWSGCKISASLSYITVREEGKMERARGSKMPYALLLPFPPHTSAGWSPICLFVTINEAQRYLATGILMFQRKVLPSSSGTSH